MAKKTKASGDKPSESAEKVDSLFASSKKVDPALASLFASSTPWQATQAAKAKTNGKSTSTLQKEQDTIATADEQEETTNEESEDEDDDGEEWSSENEEDEQSESESEGAEIQAEEGAEHIATQVLENSTESTTTTKARRKRKRDDEDLESKYMQRLAEEEEREESKREQERHSKRQKAHEDETDDKSESETDNDDEDDNEEEEDDNNDVEMEDAESDEEKEEYEVPQHESLATSQTPEVEKANRTVFLGNVSSNTVTSKTAKKTLIQHMSSFLEAMPKDKVPHKVESTRFRSTAYTNMLPKKASYVTQDLMESTTKTTNVYIVYTTKAAAREALKLNGTVVLGRHLRVDSVAHPSKTEPRKCVFVGNLGFVDDESAIQAAKDEEGKKKRKSRKKQPSDIEEGLWREFGKCGTVENVRVVRDSKTRVGKGFAYVQFTDENAVEAALLYDGKNFPPMLPRKLRVSRAKAIKRNAAKKDTGSRPSNGVYNPKVSGQQKSAMGRASKLLGRAGAALINRPGRPGVKPGQAGQVKSPEDFVFEGHRATPGSHMNKKRRVTSKKRGKPDNRSTRRANAWKTGGAK